MALFLKLMWKLRLPRFIQTSLFLAFFGSTILVSGSELSLEDYDPLRISISNQHENDAVRCQLVLAHFVTYDLNRVESGKEISFSILLSPIDSTLFYNHSGKLMAIEDLFCGLHSDWSTTRQELSLTPLQTKGSASLNFRCTVNPGFLCTVVELDSEKTMSNLSAESEG